MRFLINNDPVYFSETPPNIFDWTIPNDLPDSVWIRTEAVDATQLSSSDSVLVFLKPAPRAPIGTFDSDRQVIMKGESISFTDLSRNIPTSWEWEFGDGNTGSERHPEHQYTSSGNYTVSLAVSNEIGSDTVVMEEFITVTTLLGGSTGTFTDFRDGKTYKTVEIGDQVWMAENLAYKTDNGSYVYNDNEANANFYGRLYNWNSAKTACPNGWHLPSDNEWKELETFLGISTSELDLFGPRGVNEGSLLKASKGWGPEGNGNNDSEFSVLPCGFLYHTGLYFDHEGTYAYFWSSTEMQFDAGFGRRLNSSNHGIRRLGSYKSYGFSVRCIKDE